MTFPKARLKRRCQRLSPAEEGDLSRAVDQSSYGTTNAMIDCLRSSARSDSRA